MIRVQMLRQHRALRVGQIVELHDGVAELLIRYGKAERCTVPDADVDVEDAPGRARVERCVPPETIDVDVDESVDARSPAEKRTSQRPRRRRKARVSHA